MVKKIIPAISVLILLGSCSALKQIDVANNKPITPVNSTVVPGKSTATKHHEVKFLNHISASPTSAENNQISIRQPKGPQRDEIITLKPAEQLISINDNAGDENSAMDENPDAAIALRSKYASMMKTDLSRVQDLKLYEYIDDWYGTPYKLGGTTKNGVDCSAFVQSLFATVYGINLPRTSKYQHTATKRISTTQLKEGDLLFFHTRRNFRGVTHVGIYLQNNKFVQASSSGGVIISDMYDPYYVKHLIGAGRAISNN
ncbi:MAG: C40 family peptidase [Bacteroidetes bacterium]|nr:C40 family peptidase [Bacteroidota bacterium]MBS1632991.1 C40 family peptidase [Bacteroidota bacterium]